LSARVLGAGAREQPRGLAPAVELSAEVEAEFGLKFAARG
jgi:hypothetical protein